MNIFELTPELKEKARACKTAEEIKAFLASEAIELTEEQLESISGGNDNLGSNQCPADHGSHSWEKSGKTRPGRIWGDLWPDCEYRCTKCGCTEWRWW